MWWPRPRWKREQYCTLLSLFVTIAIAPNAAVMADEGQLCDNGGNNTSAVVWTTALCTMLLVLAVFALYFLYCKRRERDWSSLWWKSNSDKSIALQTSLPGKGHQQEKNGGTDNPAFAADTCADGRVAKTGSTRTVRLPPPTVDGECLGIEISTKVEDDKPIYVCKHDDGSKDRLVALRLVFDKEQQQRQQDGSLTDLNRALVELSRKYGLQVELETEVEAAAAVSAASAAASPAVAGEKAAKCAKPNILSAVRGTAQRLWQQRQLVFKGGDGRADETDKTGDAESRGADAAVTAVTPQKSSCTVTTVDETAAAAQQQPPARSGDGSLRYRTLEYGASPADMAAHASQDSGVQYCSINAPEPAAVSMVSAVMAAAASVKNAAPAVPVKDAVVQVTVVPDGEAAVRATVVPDKDAVQVTVVPDKDAAAQVPTATDRDAVVQVTTATDRDATATVTVEEAVARVSNREDTIVIAVEDEKRPTKASNDGPKHAAAGNPPPPPPPRKYSAASTASSLSHCSSSAAADTSMTTTTTTPAPPKVQQRPVSDIRMDDDYYWCTTTAMAPPQMSTFGKRPASGFKADGDAETTRDDNEKRATEYGSVTIENEKDDEKRAAVDDEKRAAVDDERDAVVVAVSDDSSRDVVVNGGGGGTTSIEDASLPSFSSDEEEDEDNYNGGYADKTKFSADDDDKCNGQMAGDVDGGGRRKNDDGRTTDDAKVVASESAAAAATSATVAESKSPTRLPTLRLSLSSATTASCCSSSASSTSSTSTSSSPTNNGSTNNNNNNNSPIVSKIPVRRQSAGSNGTGTTVVVSSPLSNGTAKKSIPLPLSRSGSRLAMWSSAN